MKAFDRLRLVKPNSSDYDLDTKGTASSATAARGTAVLGDSRTLGALMRSRNWQFIASLILAFAAMLAPGPLLKAQDRSGMVMPNTVWVGADGKFESEPDTALVQFNISAQEDKLQDANQRATQAAEQIRQLLRSNGIDPKDAQIGPLRGAAGLRLQEPEAQAGGLPSRYRHQRQGEGFFQGRAHHRRSGEHGRDQQSVASAISSTIWTRPRSKRWKTRCDGLTMKPVLWPAPAGGRLGELSYASVDTFEPTPIRPMMMAKEAAPMALGAAAPPPPTAEFGAQKITVTAHVNALYMLK